MPMLETFSFRPSYATMLCGRAPFTRHEEQRAWILLQLCGPSRVMDFNPLWKKLATQPIPTKVQLKIL